MAFLDHELYGLLAGAGCSHGVPTVPNGVFRVGPGGTWSLIADLSGFLATHPAANLDDADFEPARRRRPSPPGWCSRPG